METCHAGTVVRAEGKMTRVASMMFDLELDSSAEEGREKGVGEPGLCPRQHIDREEALREISPLVTPANQLEAILQMHCSWAETAKVTCAESPRAETSSWAALAAHLSSLGHDVSVRRCSPATQDDFLRHLRHTSLVVRASPRIAQALGLPSNLEVVIDPAFRDQFRIPFRCPGYEVLLDAIPQVFVGSLVALRDLVAIMAKHVMRVFECHGVPLAPWRHVRALTSKWMPQQDSDTPWYQDVERDTHTAGVSARGSSRVNSPVSEIYIP